MKSLISQYAIYYLPYASFFSAYAQCNMLYAPQRGSHLTCTSHWQWSRFMASRYFWCFIYI